MTEDKVNGVISGPLVLLVGWSQVLLTSKSHGKKPAFKKILVN